MGAKNTKAQPLPNIPNRIANLQKKLKLAVFPRGHVSEKQMRKYNVLDIQPISR